jgi:hypothetical protein
MAPIRKTMRARLAPEPECARAGSVTLSSGDLAGLNDVDGFGQLPGAPGQQRPHSDGADHGWANKRVSLTNAQGPGQAARLGPRQPGQRRTDHLFLRCPEQHRRARTGARIRRFYVWAPHEGWPRSVTAGALPSGSRKVSYLRLWMPVGLWVVRLGGCDRGRGATAGMAVWHGRCGGQWRLTRRRRGRGGGGTGRRRGRPGPGTGCG